MGFRESFARAAFSLRFCRPGIFKAFAKNGEERNKKRKVKKNEYELGRLGGPCDDGRGDFFHSDRDRQVHRYARVPVDENE
jgi:hypothetical protein